MKTVLALSLFFLIQTVFAENYYRDSTLAIFNDPNSTLETIQSEITLLSKNQISSITYDQARKFLFGKLFLKELTPKSYTVIDVYCNRSYDKSHGVGINQIPNPQYLNCEHTWPQSKFSKNFPSELQKTDLHHLFPTDMKANSTRNNFPFGEVNGKVTHGDCHDSQIGKEIETGTKSFEPPFEHKGNVARAMMYFSTRYVMPIDSTQLKYLKKWNKEDPVDQEELLRNEEIMNIQGNRNPFIDHPELIERF
jgi:deoxyribonuclease-1